MIFVISGADASANNLGKINIKTKVSDTTKTILQTLTKYSDDSEQAFALDSFIESAKTQSWWDKIDLLTLPFLANNVKQIFYNIKTQTLLTSGSETCLNDDKFVLDNNGGYYSIRTTAITNEYITMPFNFTFKGSLGFIVLNTKTEYNTGNIATSGLLSAVTPSMNTSRGDIETVYTRANVVTAIDPYIAGFIPSASSLIFNKTFFVAATFDRTHTSSNENEFHWYYDSSKKDIINLNAYANGEATSNKWMIGKHIAMEGKTPLKAGMLFHSQSLLAEEEIQSIRSLITELVDALELEHA